MFILMQRRERHYEDRMMRVHDRLNSLTVEVLGVIQANTRALTAVVTLMKVEDK